MTVFSYWGITWWGTISVSGLTGDKSDPFNDITLLLLMYSFKTMVIIIMHDTVHIGYVVCNKIIISVLYLIK